MNRAEDKFYRALKDVFIGAKVEGESGYINLMRIKSRYFEQGVFPELRQVIEDELIPFPGFREELFDKLFNFFHRYFSESGSIYFRYTPLHQKVYEQVYTDERDVMLFWKTHMLYYVKTDRLFQNMETEVDGRKFVFDVSGLQHKQANEKRSLVFEFRERRGDGGLVFDVTYSERGRKTKLNDMRKGLKAAGTAVDEDVLEQAFRLFERQSEVDYFINKDAGAFLREQFELWLFQYIFQGETGWTAARIAQLQTLRGIAHKIIDFIAQFEDELVKVWNKPKFVLDAHYIITLDRVAELDPALLPRFLAHAGFGAQVAEWRELGMVGEGFGPGDLWEKDLFGQKLHPRFQFLPLDTRHFPDLQAPLLAQVDHLDEALDGWLINSENYQALNTLLPKFGGRVKCIYIDPPYNTSASEILYNNEYKHSSWLTLVENRLQKAKQLLGKDGILCVAIDDAEYHRLYMLLARIFTEESVLGTICIRSNPSGRSTPSGISPAHEYAIFVANGHSVSVGRLPRTEKQLARYDEEDKDGAFEWVNFRKHGGLNANRIARRRLYYPIYASNENKVRIPRMEWNGIGQEWIALEENRSDETVVYPVNAKLEEKTWKWGHETVLSNLSELRARPDQTGEVGIYMKSRMKAGTLPLTWWDKKEYSATSYGTNLLTNIFGDSNQFSFPKSIHAVEDSLRVADLQDEDLCLDFFGGSGTTAHAVINLNREDGGRRRYILVEMADYFESVILPRIKKVVFCDSWKDGQAQTAGQGVSHFCKVFRLEQYEQTLRRARYEDADLFHNLHADPFTQYVFLRDLKMLDAIDLDAQADAVTVDLSRLYEGIDVAESLSCVTGKAIRRVDGESVTFEDGTVVDLTNPPWELVKPLIWW